MYVRMFVCDDQHSLLADFYYFFTMRVCMYVSGWPNLYLFSNKFRKFGENSKNKESYNKMAAQ